jgi:hypothetical protein
VNLGKKLLPAVCALVLAALVPTAAAAEQCPTGQYGTPPYCTTAFQLQTVKHEGVQAKIRVKVPGPGTITASAKKYLLTTKATAKSAGRFWLPLKLSKEGIEAAHEAPAHSLRVRIAFVYTPTVGTPGTRHKKIRFTAA